MDITLDTLREIEDVYEFKIYCLLLLRSKEYTHKNPIVSYREISEETNISLTKVKQVMKTLIETRRLEKIKHKEYNNGLVSNQYKIIE